MKLIVRLMMTKSISMKNNEERIAHEKLHRLIDFFDTLCMETQNSADSIPAAIYLCANLNAYVRDKLLEINEEDKLTH